MPSTKYSKPAVIIHWVMAVLIFVMFLLAWFKDSAISELVSPIGLHKSIGLILLATLAFRFYIKIKSTAPAPLPSWSPNVIKGAKLGHLILYILMTVVLLSGLFMAIYGSKGISFFGIPLFTGLGLKSISSIFKEIHEISTSMLITVVVVHILAALNHKLIDKDATIDRMSL